MFSLHYCLFFYPHTYTQLITVMNISVFECLPCVSTRVIGSLFYCNPLFHLLILTVMVLNFTVILKSSIVCACIFTKNTKHVIDTTAIMELHFIYFSN